MYEAIPTVYVVDDEECIRQSIHALMVSDGLACQTFDSSIEFLERYTSGTRGCAILDVRMPDMDGLQLHNQMQMRGYSIPVLFLTGYADVPLAVESLKSGAVDFIEKPFRPDELLQRVRLVIKQDQDHYDIRMAIKRLSPREHEILDLIVEGVSTKSIATHLGSSFNTVRNQRSSILRKMKADTVVDLVRMVTMVRPS